MSQSTKPETNLDFLLIGGTKAGTESIYEYFLRHPEVSTGGAKEKHYFSRGVFGQHYTGFAKEIASIDEYRRHLSHAAKKSKTGDFDPLTLHGPSAVSLIAQLNPEAKIAAILRNPIERAHSYFWMNVREGFEDRPLAVAIKSDHALYAAGSQEYCPLIRLGFYAAQIENFQQVFGADRMRIWLYEDYETDAGRVLHEMCEFIGVRFMLIPKSVLARVNAAGVPRFLATAALLRARRTWLRPLRDVYVKLPWKMRRFIKNSFLTRRIKVPPMASEDRQFLADVYKEDIQKLGTLLNRNLSGWLRDPANPMR